MTDLSDFLLARVAEDEDVARAASNYQEPWAVYLSTYLPGFGEMRFQALRWSPARVLAECEAKRRIVETFVMWQYGDTILSYLATPYSDHPDYREEWKP